MLVHLLVVVLMLMVGVVGMVGRGGPRYRHIAHALIQPLCMLMRGGGRGVVRVGLGGAVGTGSRNAIFPTRGRVHVQVLGVVLVVRVGRRTATTTAGRRSQTVEGVVGGGGSIHHGGTRMHVVHVMMGVGVGVGVGRGAAGVDWT